MKITGRGICAGIAIGKIAIYKKTEGIVPVNGITDVSTEMSRFTKAKDMAAKQLLELYQKVVIETGDKSAEVFDAHRMLLEDHGFIETITDYIMTGLGNAQSAVKNAEKKYCDMFEAMDDEYMRERAADIKDISNRLIINLNGKIKTPAEFLEPVILVADELSPSETVLLDKTKILSFVMRKATDHSHTAILAKTMNIPSLSGIDYTETMDGKMAIVDGDNGILIVDPTEKEIEQYKKIKQQEEEKSDLLQNLKNEEAVTKNGIRIQLYANVGNEDDIDQAVSNTAEGIGLFRSEFLFLGKDRYPTEEEQFSIYRRAAQKMGNKRVVIRTMDIGADKKADYLEMEEEENPAMGNRAIRFCLEHKDVFKVQLRAIFRAACYGNIAVMFPMITSVDEVSEIKQLIIEVWDELEKKKIPYKKASLGIMIETPAAVLISEELAKEVDFFSIGTNDLTQYTLAADRQNQKIEKYYNSHHPAVLKMIEMVVDNGHKHGCSVGICGELATDFVYTELFLRMGIDSLSVSPSKILLLKEKIRNSEIS